MKYIGWSLLILVAFFMSGCLSIGNRYHLDVWCSRADSFPKNSSYVYNIRRHFPLIDTSIFNKDLVVFSRFSYSSANWILYLLDIGSGDLLKIVNQGELKVVKKGILGSSNRDSFDACVLRLKNINMEAFYVGATDGSADNLYILQNGLITSYIRAENFYNFEEDNKDCLSVEQKQALVYIYKMAFGAKYKMYKKW